MFETRLIMDGLERREYWGPDCWVGRWWLFRRIERFAYVYMYMFAFFERVFVFFSFNSKDADCWSCVAIEVFASELQLAARTRFTIVVGWGAKLIHLHPNRSYYQPRELPVKVGLRRGKCTYRAARPLASV